MTLWKHYHIAQSISDAVEALNGAPGPARPIGGGSDLLLDIQQGRHPPVHTLVDVTQIPDLTVIEQRGDHLFVGAAAPLNQIVASPLVRQHAQALQEACGLIGGPQVRNTATLGGNVAHALPAADGTIALMALGAQAEVANRQGCRWVPLGELFLGPGRSVLSQSDEPQLLVGFHLPLMPGRAVGSAFRRVMRPQGVAIAILNMGAWIRRDGEQIAAVHIAVGPAGPTPFRSSGAESALLGRAPEPAALEAALQALLAEARFRTSPHRATTGYRRHIAGMLLQEVVVRAWERAGGQ